MTMTGPTAITDTLVADARAFSFVNAIRILEASVPGAAPLGGTGPASREAIRLRPPLSLSFPGSDIAEIERLRAPDGRERYRVTAAMLGLYGSVSPLPTYYTERLLAEDEDGPVRALYDLINHRLLSLLYRIFLKYRPHLGGDVGLASVDHEHRLQRLLGVPDELPGGVHGRYLLAFAGLLATPARSADAMERLLGGYFATTCAVDQCIARWTTLPAGARTQLGHGNCRLGQDVVAGDRVMSRATAYRVTLGPVPWTGADDFHQGGRRHADLLALIRFFDPQQLDVVIDLVVDTADLPDLPLGDPRCRAGRAAHGLGARPRYITRTIHSS